MFIGTYTYLQELSSVQELNKFKIGNQIEKSGIIIAKLHWNIVPACEPFIFISHLGTGKNIVLPLE